MIDITSLGIIGVIIAMLFNIFSKKKKEKKDRDTNTLIIILFFFIITKLIFKI